MKKLDLIKVENLATLLASGKKVAFIEGNRDIVKKNVQNKKNSFEDFGCNIIPLLYVSGEKAVNDGCKLVDENGMEITDPETIANTIAIVDGQHRYCAAIANGFSHEALFLLEDYSGANTKKLIAGANCDSFTWNTKDYVNGAVLMNPENEIAQFCKELVNRGFSSTTIGLILFFGSARLTQKDFGLLMEGKDIRKKDECDLQRAYAYLEAAKAFDDKYLSHHYLIDAVIRLSKEYGYRFVLPLVSNLTKEERERIKTAKSDNAVNIAYSVIASHIADVKAA